MVARWKKYSFIAEKWGKYIWRKKAWNKLRNKSTTRISKIHAFCYRNKKEYFCLVDELTRLHIGNKKTTWYENKTFGRPS